MDYKLIYTRLWICWLQSKSIFLPYSFHKRNLTEIWSGFINNNKQ